MACHNCKVEYINGKCGARTVTCEPCGYNKTPITHSMANSIAVEREIEKARKISRK